MMNKTYGVVLVGCGHIGSAHMDEIYYREGIKVIGVSDVDPVKAQLFAKKYASGSWNTDYKAYLEDPQADIFIIATYTSTHLTILKDCLAHGKHVLCEKPITPTLEEGKEFVRLVKQSGSKVLVGLILRHNKTYREVAKMLKSGVIGSPIVIRMVQNHHTMDWSRYEKLLEDCPPIIDCGIHYIDVMRWFTGAEIVKVGGITAVTDSEVPTGSYNYCMLNAALSDGSVAYYEAGWGNTIASENLKEFIGPLGRISLTLMNDRKVHREEGDLIELYLNETKTYQITNMKSKYKPTWTQLKQLISMIESGCEGTPPIDDVFKAFEVSCIADTALREKKFIDLPQ